MKLPGNLKTKKIILAVLVLISIVVVTQFAVENRKTDVKEDSTIEEEVIENKNSEDKVEIHDQPVSEEDSLYKEAYDTFFQGDYDGAVKKADEVISKYPESYKAYNIRGIAKAFAGNFQDGMNDIDRSLEIDSNYGYARYNKALNYELYGYYNEALIWYDKALDIEQYMWSYYGIASIYGRRGDVSNTVKYLEEAVKAEGAEDGKSAIKEEAKTEEDFDPVRSNKEFQNFINS